MLCINLLLCTFFFLPWLYVILFSMCESLFPWWVLFNPFLYTYIFFPVGFCVVVDVVLSGGVDGVIGVGRSGCP